LALAACAGAGLSPPGSAPAAAESENMVHALVEARDAIEAARARFALWTTADEAYQEALSAQSQGDTTRAVEAARRALELARLGLAQADAPLSVR